MRGLYPVSLACEVLEVSASGYFTWLRRRQASRSGPPGRHSNEVLLAHIRAIHAEVKGEYGWPRMHKELLARGIRVGKDRVRKLMKQHGIKAKTKRKFVVTTDSRHNLPVAPDLVQRLGEWDTELIEHWFHSFAQAAGITLHVETLYGSNNHHIVESCFKGLARALRQAVEIDPRKADAIPSTKGML